MAGPPCRGGLALWLPPPRGRRRDPWRVSRTTCKGHAPWRAAPLPPCVLSCHRAVTLGVATRRPRFAWMVAAPAPLLGANDARMISISTVCPRKQETTHELEQHPPRTLANTPTPRASRPDGQAAPPGLPSSPPRDNAQARAQRHAQKQGHYRSHQPPPSSRFSSPASTVANASDKSRRARYVDSSSHRSGRSA